MPTCDEWFNRALRDYCSGVLPTYKILDLGRSPYFAFQGWFSKIPILMGQNMLHKAVDKHIIDLAGFENLPSRLQAPAAIFESSSQPGRFVFVTDLVLDGKIVVVPVVLTQNRDSGTHWKVVSIHARDAAQLRLWKEKGLLRFSEPSNVLSGSEKEKDQVWSQDSAPCNWEQQATANLACCNNGIRSIVCKENHVCPSLRLRRTAALPFRGGH